MTNREWLLNKMQNMSDEDFAKNMKSIKQTEHKINAVIKEIHKKHFERVILYKMFFLCILLVHKIIFYL